MGRRIRRVPPNWRHPKELYRGKMEYIEMFDEDYESALRAGNCFLDPKYYRPAWTEEIATWYQVYETVSSGTPITPPFETKEQLAYHLYTKGTSWDDRPWSREAAMSFVEEGWLPSGKIEDNRLVDLTQESL